MAALTLLVAARTDAGTTTLREAQWQHFRAQMVRTALHRLRLFRWLAGLERVQGTGFYPILTAIIVASSNASCLPRNAATPLSTRLRTSSAPSL